MAELDFLSCVSGFSMLCKKHCAMWRLSLFKPLLTDVLVPGKLSFKHLNT
jgi:hypothetical protein